VAVVEQDMHGDEVMIIPAESWPAVRAEVSDLLDAVERGGLDAAIRWMTSRGLQWATPRQRGRGDPLGPSSPPPVRAAANPAYMTVTSRVSNAPTS
jgi:hypothetical protein